MRIGDIPLDEYRERFKGEKRSSWVRKHRSHVRKIETALMEIDKTCVTKTVASTGSVDDVDLQQSTTYPVDDTVASSSAQTKCAVDSMQVDNSSVSTSSSPSSEDTSAPASTVQEPTKTEVVNTEAAQESSLNSETVASTDKTAEISEACSHGDDASNPTNSETVNVENPMEIETESASSHEELPSSDGTRPETSEDAKVGETDLSTDESVPSSEEVTVVEASDPSPVSSDEVPMETEARAEETVPVDGETETSNSRASDVDTKAVETREKEGTEVLSAESSAARSGGVPIDAEEERIVRAKKMILASTEMRRVIDPNDDADMTDSDVERLAESLASDPKAFSNFHTMFVVGSAARKDALEAQRLKEQNERLLSMLSSVTEASKRAEEAVLRSEKIMEESRRQKEEAEKRALELELQVQANRSEAKSIERKISEVRRAVAGPLATQTDIVGDAKTSPRADGKVVVGLERAPPKGRDASSPPASEGAKKGESESKSTPTPPVSSAPPAERRATPPSVTKQSPAQGKSERPAVSKESTMSFAGGDAFGKKRASRDEEESEATPGLSLSGSKSSKAARRCEEDLDASSSAASAERKKNMELEASHSAAAAERTNLVRKYNEAFVQGVGFFSTGLVNTYSQAVTLMYTMNESLIPQELHSNASRASVNTKVYEELMPIQQSVFETKNPSRYQNPHADRLPSYGMTQHARDCFEFVISRGESNVTEIAN